MSTKIKDMAYQMEDWLIETRRHFHRHPEPSMEEYWTTDEIVKILEEWGIEVHRFENCTGCLAYIRGAHPGQTVALRSDIDALTVLEKNDIDYKSEIEGMMHACGHDTHLTMNLGAAKILHDLRGELHGTVIHIFQPGEEVAQGAKATLENDEWFKEVDNVFGMHIWTNMDSGKISVEAGPRMAAADYFKVDIEGVSGHGAQPEQTVDATVVAAHMITNFQPLVSREVAPTDSLVVTVGQVNSGTRFNIISGSASMEGTVRYFTPELNQNIKEMMERIVQNTASMYRAKATLDYRFYTYPVINDEASSAHAQKTVTKLFGEDANQNYEKTTGGEDFSEFLKHKPGCFAFVGCRNPEVLADKPHHSDYFMVDEAVFKDGTALYAQYAYDFLNGH
ncbi:MAG TPA: amidohydrolase [Erysipelothrix sp.]|nr:amidohydrolase [Erysipelothrix sp.]